MQHCSPHGRALWEPPEDSWAKLRAGDIRKPIVPGLNSLIKCLSRVCHAQFSAPFLWQRMGWIPQALEALCSLILGWFSGANRNVCTGREAQHLKHILSPKIVALDLLIRWVHLCVSLDIVLCFPCSGVGDSVFSTSHCCSVLGRVLPGSQENVWHWFSFLL